MRKILLETSRLELREFNNSDAQFIIELVNTPTWLKFIGDRNIHTVEDAEKYMGKYINSYKEKGYGFWLVQLKNNKTPIGICGLIKRDYLENIDIGFAFLPEFAGKGYGFEAAQATLNYANKKLDIKPVAAFTHPENKISISLITKLGLEFEKSILDDKDESLLYFVQKDNSKDIADINILIKKFFSIFNNKNGNTPNLELINKFFVPGAIITTFNDGVHKVNNLEEFIEPRKKLFNEGTLTDFSEYEISGKMEFYNKIAQRFSIYEKSGYLNGKHFIKRGMKSFQFIKTNNEWKISSLCWCDED